MNNKTNKELGLQVHDYLVKQGVETPYNVDNLLMPDHRIKVITEHMQGILTTLGMDMTDDSLADTPKRVAKMYVHEIFSGLDYANFPKCTAVENKMHYDEMVLVRDITCVSQCEHHFAAIDQKCNIAYIPNKKVIGLSKLNRLCKFFAQRPQIQERFTEQVYHSLAFILDTPHVAVVVDGKHYCVAQRGVEDHASWTLTSKLGGKFKADHQLRAEFMALIRK